MTCTVGRCTLCAAHTNTILFEGSDVQGKDAVGDISGNAKSASGDVSGAAKGAAGDAQKAGQDAAGSVKSAANKATSGLN